LHCPLAARNPLKLLLLLLLLLLQPRRQLPRQHRLSVPMLLTTRSNEVETGFSIKKSRRKPAFSSLVTVFS